tara:strand:- start:179661 stop:179846 length:186 start_codon:yes stop_codon:yes gene_type:complete
LEREVCSEGRFVLAHILARGIFCLDNQKKEFKMNSIELIFAMNDLRKRVAILSLLCFVALC